MDNTANRQTILIVDDNPTNLSVIVDYLESHNFHIVIARDGETAIRRAQFAHPAIILLDVMMPPGIDGFETCRRLKINEATKDIPVIFMTALARVEDKVTGFSVGAVDYVTKPIQQEEVLARVTTHLTLQAQKKRLEELARELQKKNMDLAELNASKDKFFTIIAHDLRTPFNGLLGNAQLLLLEADRYSRNEITEIVDDIYASARVTYDLLQNLLNWALLQQGQMAYQPAPTSLNEIITRDIRLVCDQATQKNITLVNDIKVDITVVVDTNMIDTVIRNLLSNSIKFTPDGGTVAVLAQVEPGQGSTDRWARVFVTDNGIGMSSDVIENLFHLDSHHTSLGTEQEKGTGLGLVLCKEMVGLHGGSLKIDSLSGKGTTIEFTIPMTAG